MAIYSLSNSIKHHEWGSTSLIPTFMGLANLEGRPVAEVWMGTHPGGPSRVETGEGEKDLLAVYPSGVPYLVKLLAARQALSIQAHPNLEQARNGFAQENARNLNAVERNYKDPNHKPEIMVALEGPFHGMVGFRHPDAIQADITVLRSLAPRALPILDLMEAALASEGLRGITRAVLNVSRERWKEQEGGLAEAFESWDSPLGPWFKKLRQTYSGDPTMLFCIILNVFALQPGEALFTPAGCLHAYMEGFGLELMAASDNVLRGGLTRKAIDKEELERIIVFEAAPPHLLKPIPTASGEDVFIPPVPDFRLSCLKGQNRVFELGIVPSPWIIVVAQGTAQVRQGMECVDLKKGQSIVILPGEDVTVTVQGMAYRAWTVL